MAPEATATALPDGSAPSTTVASVPALTLTLPPNVLAEVRYTAPAPVLVSVLATPAPSMLPRETEPAPPAVRACPARPSLRCTDSSERSALAVVAETSAASVTGRLTVHCVPVAVLVTGPVSVRPVPSSANPPSVNSMPATVVSRSFVLDCRRSPEKRRVSPSLGAMSPTQFAAVLHLSSVPPPSHVCVSGAGV